MLIDFLALENFFYPVIVWCFHIFNNACFYPPPKLLRFCLLFCFFLPVSTLLCFNKNCSVHLFFSTASASCPTTSLIFWSQFSKSSINILLASSLMIPFSITFEASRNNVICIMRNELWKQSSISKPSSLMTLSHLADFVHLFIMYWYGKYVICFL